MPKSFLAVMLLQNGAVHFEKDENLQIAKAGMTALTFAC